MFRYYYTQDMRISDIRNLLKECAEYFVNNNLPSAYQNKGVNNSCNTAGFYFNVKSGRMNKLALKGNVDEVMLNFVKKFQFPNTRDKRHFKTYIQDEIKLAPLRVVIQVLFVGTLIDGKNAYITMNEITDFIFYNSNVAKASTFNSKQLYDEIISYRNNQSNSNLQHIASTTERSWVGQDRQLREMLNILLQLNILYLKDHKFKLNLFDEKFQINSAILEIIKYNDFWNYEEVFDGQTIDDSSIDEVWGQLIESYESYMNDEQISAIDNTEDNEDISTSYDYKEELKGDNILFYGVPGVGKSYNINKNYAINDISCKRVVFHPDYTNSDFIGQLLPKRVDGKLEYIFNPGPFTKILDKAIKDPYNMYYLIIEEINRGNAPAIFGDIFQLLDRCEDTGFSEYCINNEDISTYIYGLEDHKITIPNNLTILATMNTADQNVFTLDTAFQRRWQMSMVKNELKNASHYNTNILNTSVTWGEFAEKINETILENSSGLSSVEDKRLGAYFVKESDLEYVVNNNGQTNKFSGKVLKYLWDDAFKYNKEDIFDSKYKSLEEVIEDFEGSVGMGIFKDGLLEDK